MSDNLLDPKQLAAYLNVPVSWVYERTRPAAKDPLPVERVGKYVRFDLAAVLEHLKKKRGR